jgi:ubiquinone/menaquinone biosynthesis C-methylase UbiE
MSFYSRVIFPRICDFLLDTELVREHRQKLLAPAAGRILEIGFGTGLNLPHYPPSVRQITAVDPNPGMLSLAARRIAQTQIEVDRQTLSGERLPLETESFDCVVSTFTLCSIRDVSQALAEIFRVLKPGGRFLFFEHGLSPDPGVQKWQRRLNWLQKRLGDGCHLDRDMRALVSDQPFSHTESTEFYLENMPKTHAFIYTGTATK